MGRTRASARAAGSRLERQIADALAAHVDDRIDRRVRTGAADKGDIGGVRTTTGARVVVEVKNCARTSLAGWHAEAETERRNDVAEVALVVHKRHGRADPLDQWVTCTVRDLVPLLGTARPPDRGAGGPAGRTPPRGPGDDNDATESHTDAKGRP